ISEQFNIPVRTVQHVAKQVREGTHLVENPCKKRGSYRLSDDDVQFLLSLISRTPDLYLSELREKLFEAMKVEVSISTIYRTLRRAGLTRKTITKAARERDEAKRAEYQARIAKYHPQERVYVDES
ncbi:hypothetical protein CPB86DRAFT_688557, partial [Serendipita vermifera]